MSIFLFSEWYHKFGQTAPSYWPQRISDIFDSNDNKEFETEYNDRIFSFVIMPVAGAGYVNIYGRYITKHKNLEELK